MTREEIGAILKQLRIDCGMTQKEVAQQIGRTQQIVGHWETGYAQPDANTLFKLCEIYNTTVDDAFGFSKKQRAISNIEWELIKKYHELDDFGRESVDMTLERETKRVKQARETEKKIEILEKQNEAISTHLRLLAYYGKIAAAGKSFGFEDLLSGATIEVPDNSDSRHADYTIGVSGDSMEPTFYDGDIVYVKKVEHLNTGDIGIFQKDSCVYIKEVGDGELISHNSKYKPILGDGVKLLGKVIGKVNEDYKINT